MDVSLVRDLIRGGQLLVALELTRRLLLRLDAPRRCERSLRGRDVRGPRARPYEELAPRCGLEERRRGCWINEHAGVLGREGVV